jgi:hypothetical protein
VLQRAGVGRASALGRVTEEFCALRSGLIVSLAAYPPNATRRRSLSHPLDAGLTRPEVLMRMEMEVAQPPRPERWDGGLSTCG